MHSSLCACVSARSFEHLATRCLSLSEPEDRNEEEWSALQSFADALNKKFNKAIVGQEQQRMTMTTIQRMD